jgi:excisionase family DNA binding protein
MTQYNLSEEAIEAIADRVALKIGGMIAPSLENFTVAEVANITKKHQNTILNHIKQGILKATRPGGSYIISKEALENYLADKKTQSLDELLKSR